ncbi:MAG: hypothetical protein HGB36_03355 [Chlorobiaceae bacterium]|nr:hypothetical protein [Chlorobiaceae bacterium]
MQRKKSFRDVDHPAAAFISSNEAVLEGHGNQLHDKRDDYYTSDLHHTASGFAGNEPKSKRLNLLVRPSMMKDFTKIAYMRRSSINDLINRLIAECVSKDGSLIEEYDRMFRDKSQK